MVPTHKSSPPPLSIDHEAFARELRELRAEIDREIDLRDLLHLKKLERWGRLCTAAGYATAWIGPNPISAYLISQGNTCRWTIMMHHVGHRGLDRGAGAPERYTSKGFAVGARRFVDWLDWILPEAWRYEHNILHHYHTGEIGDPDLVEVNMRQVREAQLPLALKYAVVAFYACTWKLTYYAPKTFFALQEEKRRKAAAPASAPEGEQGDYFSLFNPLRADGCAFWKSCILPYATLRFGVIPALFLPLGPLAAGSVLMNSAAAEVMTNLHTFVIIAPNHAGDDLYRFEERIQGKADFYVRQVIGSTNYRTGSDVIDFLHGFLNYQIEHHLFPDLPPLKYQQIQPRVKALCEKYGVPYVQESVFRRVKKVVDVMVGKASMRSMAAPARRSKRAERDPDLEESEAGASG